MGFGKKFMSFFGIVDEGEDAYREEPQENTRRVNQQRSQNQRRDMERRQQTSDRAYSRSTSDFDRERDADEGYERYSSQQRRKNEQSEAELESGYRNHRARSRQQQDIEPPRPARRPAGYAQTVVRTMHRPSDSCEIIEQLARNNTIVLNLGELDEYNRQRVFDTLYGASYALHAKIRQTSDVTFLLAPQSVALDSGEKGEAED